MKFTTEQEAKIEQAIAGLAVDPDIQEIVKQIEGSIKTTQNHYGKYMQFLNDYVGKPGTLYVVSRAIIRAGANSQGVASALQILTGGGLI